MYQELLLQKSAKESSKRVVSIELQPQFKFPMGFKYIADFAVEFADDRKEIWDVKGVETGVFKLKKKCFQYFCPNLELKIVK